MKVDQKTDSLLAYLEGRGPYEPEWSEEDSDIIGALRLKLRRGPGPWARFRRFIWRTPFVPNWVILPVWIWVVVTICNEVFL